MEEGLKVQIRWTAVQKGGNPLLKPLLLSLQRILERGHGQVLILGIGVSAHYENEDLVPSVLGKDWTICIPPHMPNWEQLQRGLMQFSALIQEDATLPRVGIFMAPPDFISERFFPPSKTGPYPASIYWLGLNDSPLTYINILKKSLSRVHIQSPYLDCIFSAGDNLMRPSEQEKLNNAIITRADLNEIISRILQSIEEDTAAERSHKFLEAAKEIKKLSKKWWQFWR